MNLKDSPARLPSLFCLGVLFGLIGFCAGEYGPSHHPSPFAWQVPAAVVVLSLWVGMHLKWQPRGSSLIIVAWTAAVSGLMTSLALHGGFDNKALLIGLGAGYVSSACIALGQHVLYPCIARRRSRGDTQPTSLKDSE